MHAQAEARTYVKVLAALLTLTVITVLAAGINFGSFNVLIALGIASLKGSLVALYFMHLRHDKPMSAIIFLSGLLALAVFLMLCFLDTGAREVVAPAKTGAAAALSEPAPPRSPRLRFLF